MLLTFMVIFVALTFEYINGFHDTANSIATVVGTKVLTPRQAIVMAASTNLVGAYFGTAVAKTIASGIVDGGAATSGVVICALLGAIVWNLITWYFGLPSSSSHALVGGLVGAAFSVANNSNSVIKWVEVKEKVVNGVTVTEHGGIIYKVVIPMISSPVLGLVVGFFMMTFLYVFCFNWKPRTVNRSFGKLQILSSAYMGFSHGMNDATKCMGIIALVLLASTSHGDFNDLPEWMGFLKMHVPAGQTSPTIPFWIVTMCALTMAAGTAAGGWRIIKTMGHKMVKLQPVHGFAAETTAATVLAVAGTLGMPVSTTHAITTSIVGVGAAKRFSSLKFKVVEKILWAWVLTIPAAATVAYLCVKIGLAAGWLTLYVPKVK